jgi:hypothetical protein
MRRFGANWLLSVTVAVVLVACGGPAVSSSPSSLPVAAASPSSTSAATTAAPTAEATPILTPSPLPTPTTVPAPTPSDGLVVPELTYVNQFVMRVAVSGVNVRRKPSKSAVSNGKAPQGGLFMMYDWPIRADGFTWYFGFTLLTNKPGVIPDLPEPINTGYDEVLSGWMATGTEDAPFLVPLAPRCPTVRDMRNVVGMLGSERISCFGSDPVELQGTFGCGGCGGFAVGSFEPEWLAYPLAGNLLWYDVKDGGSLELLFPPDGPTPPAEGSIIRVRGHFSDARSTTCRIEEPDEGGSGSVVISNAAAEQYCRAKYVVDSFEVTGTGPLPGG